MVSSSGDRLLEPAAEKAYRDGLFPHAAVVTPNLREAEVLLGSPIRSRADQHAAARALGDLGAGAAVVKGGHPAGDPSSQGGGRRLGRQGGLQLRAPLGEHAEHAHGTGCSRSPRPRPHTWPRAKTYAPPSRRRRTSSPARSPAAPAGTSAPVTAPWTTSAGRSRRRLVGQQTGLEGVPSAHREEGPWPRTVQVRCHDPDGIVHGPLTGEEIPRPDLGERIRADLSGICQRAVADVHDHLMPLVVELGKTQDPVFVDPRPVVRGTTNVLSR